MNERKSKQLVESLEYDQCIDIRIVIESGPYWIADTVAGSTVSNGDVAWPSFFDVGHSRHSLSRADTTLIQLW